MIGFVDFCRTVLRVQLTAGQRVIALVAFDGVEPGQLEGADRDLAREIFGNVDTIPASARNVLCAMVGARAGKTYIFCALRLLHAALTIPLDSLAPGELAAGVIVAPDVRLARQALRYISGALDDHPELARCVEGETQDSVTIRRPDGGHVELICLPATRGGSSLRGRSLVGAVLDECAFFRDEQYAVNDAELFKAVAPRVMPGGQVVIASTPWTQSGLLFELFSRNHGDPKDALAAHAPTTLLRDDDHTRALVERERSRSPDNAEREFDAQPLAAAAHEFFDPAALREAIDESLPTVLKPDGTQHCTAGLDTAFRRDASAEVIARRCLAGVEVVECVEVMVPKGGRLVPSETLSQLLDRAEAQHVRSIIADGHYIESVRESIGKRRGASPMQLIEAPAGQVGKVEVYTAARTLLHERQVRIPAGNKRLLAQLRAVVAKPTPGGGLSITSPRRAGSHGDLASAFVLAAWQLSKTLRTGGRTWRIYTMSDVHAEERARARDRWMYPPAREERRPGDLTGGFTRIRPGGLWGRR